MNRCQNCHVSVCSKFCQLCFYQILAELVYSWESYRKNKRVSFFLRHNVEALNQQNIHNLQRKCSEMYRNNKKN